MVFWSPLDQVGSVVGEDQVPSAAAASGRSCSGATSKELLSEVTPACVPVVLLFGRQSTWQM